MKNKQLLFLLLLVTDAFYYSTAAQNLPGKLDTLYSNILKEKRIIRVVLPDDYKPDSIKYDVLYLLDGGYNVKMVYNVERFLEDEELMPPTIIISIGNTNRDRDFTPTHMNSYRTFGGPNLTGGAANFLSFLGDELIPYINKTYSSNNENTLFGHSLAGLFAMYVYLTRPQLFDSYILADPSLWYDGFYLPKMAADKMKTLPAYNKILCISGRQGQAYHEMGSFQMDSLLKLYVPPGLHLISSAYPDETHSSLRLKSIYDGLKFTYSGYTNYLYKSQFHIMPMNGIVVKNKPAIVHYYRDLENIRFTTDGTEPTETSPEMKKEITIISPVTFTIKSFATNPKYNLITTGNFVAGEVLSAEPKPKNMKPGGFHYAYYEGDWNLLPDFKKIKPITTGITDTSYDINKFPRKNNYACLIEGKLEIKEDGYYHFFMETGIALKLYIADKLLIDYNGSSNYTPYQSYLVPLSKGFYSFRMEYLQKKNTNTSDFLYQVPDEKGVNQSGIIKIPLALQYGWK